MKTIYYTTILLFFLLSACKSKQQNKIQKKFTVFPESVQVKIEKKSFSERMQIWDISFTENYLITTEIWIDQGYYFKVFDKENLNIIGTLGKKGPGPYEINLGSVATINREAEIAYIVDEVRAKRPVFAFDINKSLKDSAYSPKILFEIGSGDDKPYACRFTSCGSNRFMYHFTKNENDSADFYYVICNENGETIGNYVKMPETIGYPKEARARMTINEDYYANGRIYSASVYFDKILAFDLETKKLIFQSEGPEDYKPEIELHGTYWWPKEIPRKVCYKSVAASEDYVFGLYSGEYETTDNKASYGIKTIFVFDQTGEPVKKLILDQPVTKISYDKEHNQLVGLMNAESNGQTTLGLAYIHLDDYGL